MSKRAWDHHHEYLHLKMVELHREHKYVLMGIDKRLIEFMKETYPDVTDRSTVKILDVGCGQGFTTHWFAQNGFKATGFDFSKLAIEIAQTRGPDKDYTYTGTAEFAVGDATKAYPFPDSTFDLAIDISCIEVMPKDDALKALVEIRRVLKDFGKFFSIMASYKRDPELDVLGTTTRKQSFAEVTSLIKEAGFSTWEIKDSAQDNAANKTVHSWEIRAVK